MKNIGIFVIVIVLLFSCEKESQLEKDIAKIDVNFNIERFDIAFANTSPSGLPNLKNAYPFLFSPRIPDSIWIEQILW